jgi:threonine-phosphate decarboxylase
VELIHGGNVWIYGGPGKVMDFSSNINPLGPPKLLVKALMEAIRGNIFSYYPEPTYTSLKESLSLLLNVNCRLIEVFNGASEALFQVAYMLNPPSIVLTPPSFVEYWRIAESLNRRVYEVGYLDVGDSYVLDTDGVIKLLSGMNGGLMYICNPNNPTGTLTGRGDIEEIVSEASRRNVQVVVDESFMDFTAENQSVIELVETYENLHVVKSLTKVFASPGLRIGLAVSGRAKDFGRLTASWRVNTLASYSFSKLLQDLGYVKKYIDKSRRVIVREVGRVTSMLKDLGLKPYSTSVNFILVKLPLGFSSKTLTETLALRYGILIRDASTIPGLNESYVRISVRRGDDNLRLMKALGGVLSV